MDPSLNPALPISVPNEPLPGALVVLNGGLDGTRRPLTGTLTLIGQALACDLRLSSDGIHPYHCAIVRGLDGFWLRDLGTSGGTAVNGEPITERALRSGDEITVGPFLFRVDFPGPVESGPANLDAERDALRIQAAAVAAQQAALTEEELRLTRRAAALDRQEEQLATHLEERRARLVQIQEQTRADRTALQAERTAFRQEQDHLRQTLASARAQAEDANQQALKERRRLIELRKRYHRRCRKHWHAREADLRRREKELAHGLEQLHRERERLNEARLRFNGEAELGRRQLKEEWQELALAQQQWEECLNQEHAERQRRQQEFDQRARSLAAAEQALADQQRHWQEVHAALRQEVEGLEARIRNQRQKLLDQARRPAGLDGSLAGLPAPLPPVPFPSARPEADRDWPAAVRRLAGTLADQRLHLLEQWQRLLEVHSTWHQERTALLADLEARGQQLTQKEEHLLARERSLETTALDLRHRQESLAQLRCYLEGWQARLTAREAAWEGERQALLAEVQTREESVAARAQRLEVLRQRRLQRWRQEIEDLRGARTLCEDLRRQYAALWQECQQRQAALAQAQRELAGQSLALERCRLDFLARSPNAAATERRLERLRRRSAARLATAEREVLRERQLLLAEAARLEDRARRLQDQEADLTARLADWTRRQGEWEDRQVSAQDGEERWRQQVQRLEALHAQDQRQLAVLREEVERIARLLLDGAEPSAGPAQQAA